MPCRRWASASPTTSSRDEDERKEEEELTGSINMPTAAVVSQGDPLAADVTLHHL